MKKFKNTFGVTGSTHAINHFAELAVKEGWCEQGIPESKPPHNYLFFNGTMNSGNTMNLQKNMFWRFYASGVIDISTPEGWLQALALMKEVEEEENEVYANGFDKKFKPPFRVGKANLKSVLDANGIAVIIFENNSYGQAVEYCEYLNKKYPVKVEEEHECKPMVNYDWSNLKCEFKLVPQSAYLAQEEAKKEEKYDFICKHSGEGFMYGDSAYWVSATGLDLQLSTTISLWHNVSKNSKNTAYFHKESDAKDWNKRMFGEKEEVKDSKRLDKIKQIIDTAKEIAENFSLVKMEVDNDGNYNLLISKEIKDKVTIKFE